MIKKHSAYGRTIPDEVSFTKREIITSSVSQWGGAPLSFRKRFGEIATTYHPRIFNKPTAFSSQIGSIFFPRSIEAEARPRSDRKPARLLCEALLIFCSR